MRQAPYVVSSAPNTFLPEARNRLERINNKTFDAEIMYKIVVKLMCFIVHIFQSPSGYQLYRFQSIHHLILTTDQIDILWQVAIGTKILHIYIIVKTENRAVQK